MLLDVEFDEVEVGKGNDMSMKGFAMKASMSEMVSLGEREVTVRVKIFLPKDCSEEFLVIKNEVGSVDGFRGEAQERHLLGLRTWRGAKFEVEGVEVWMSGYSKEKLPVTGTEGTTRVVREVEGEDS